MKNLTYEKFLELVKDAKIDIFPKSPWQGWGKTFEPIYTEDIERISINWISGGITGGSCWGTERYNREIDKEPEFVDLDNILELINPDFKLFEYKRLLREIEETGLIKFHQKNYDGYYGNSEEISYKVIILRELYDFLVEKNLIESEEQI